MVGVMLEISIRVAVEVVSITQASIVVQDGRFGGPVVRVLLAVSVQDPRWKTRDTGSSTCYKSKSDYQ